MTEMWGEASTVILANQVPTCRAQAVAPASRCTSSAESRHWCHLTWELSGPSRSSVGLQTKSLGPEAWSVLTHDEELSSSPQSLLGEAPSPTQPESLTRTPGKLRSPAVPEQSPADS